MVSFPFITGSAARNYDPADDRFAAAPMLRGDFAGADTASDRTAWQDASLAENQDADTVQEGDLAGDAVFSREAISVFSTIERYLKNDRPDLALQSIRAVIDSKGPDGLTQDEKMFLGHAIERLAGFEDFRYEAVGLAQEIGLSHEGTSRQPEQDQDPDEPAPGQRFDGPGGPAPSF